MPRPRSTPPTAIFATDGPLTVGTLIGLKNQGWQCPDDISVVGYDGQIVNKDLRPPLTTVEQDPTGQGKAAAQIITKMIRREKVPTRQIVLPPKLIVRESTGMSCGAS